MTLEVRVHNTPEIVGDRQSIARLRLERLCEPASFVYGSSKGSSYIQQIRPKLVKYFR